MVSRCGVKRTLNVMDKEVNNHFSVYTRIAFSHTTRTASFFCCSFKAKAVTVFLFKAIIQMAHVNISGK